MIDLTKLKEVYEKYKHLDQALSDPRWDTDGFHGEDFRGHIRFELWQAIKECLEGAK